MVSDIQLDDSSVSQALQVRQQASELLGRLESNRIESERRFAETGRRDPLKFITGRTAFDNAIAAARQMIADMDALLAQAKVKVNGHRGEERHAAAHPFIRVCATPWPNPARAHKNGSTPALAASHKPTVALA